MYNNPHIMWSFKVQTHSWYHKQLLYCLVVGINREIYGFWKERAYKLKKLTSLRSYKILNYNKIIVYLSASLTTIINLTCIASIYLRANTLQSAVNEHFCFSGIYVPILDNKQHLASLTCNNSLHSMPAHSISHSLKL